MDKRFREEFRNPSSAYRGAPFWAWNGKLDPTELRRQIRLMHRMGLGGFFMHSRVGLDTAYLSDDWFECVEACLDEATKLDMKAWLYDEDRWPSGAGGGLVTSDPRHRVKSVVMTERDSAAGVKWTQDTLAMFVAVVDGATATGVRRIAKGKRPGRLAAGETLLVFELETAEGSSWYNGQTYLDTMSHDAVAKFIEVTHEAYRKRVGKAFGKVVPGIFTDEPNYGCVCAKRSDTSVSSPWTPRLPKVFRQRYGYDLIARLPELFFDIDGREVSRARYHYLDCITHLFVDAFAKQIGQWCDANNMMHTGHVLEEDSLSRQVNRVGGCLRFYEYMQAPGMDLLTEYNRNFDTARQVSSVARQFDRTWRLTETYGCTGWDFPLVGHKALGDWQAALGINLRAQHLAWYTMEGQAKRDYPAAIFYQSPWWEVYSTVEDYFGRVNVAMTRGREVRDLLVIHPNESMWLLTRKDWSTRDQVRDLDAMLMALRDSLDGAALDFDYGDEEMLGRHGKVSRKGERPTLRVAKASYAGVIVPPLITMRSTTLALLKRFHAAGGTVIFAGAPAPYVDAVSSDAVVAFAADCTRTPVKGAKLVAAAAAAGRRISITDDAGESIVTTLHQLREDADAFYLFVCNTGHTAAQRKPINNDVSRVRQRTAAFDDVRIRGFAGCASSIEMDPQSGEMTAARAVRADGGWEIRTSLPAIGSRLFVIPKTAAKAPKVPPAAKEMVDVRSRAIGDRRTMWDVTLSEANALVLDRPRYRIGSGRFRKADDILRVDMVVRESLGVPVRGGRMTQPWARVKSANPKRTIVQLAYTFEVAAVPSGELHLAIERPETFDIAVNGTSVSTDTECGWWCDRSCRKLPINPAVLRVGTNEVILTCDYDVDHPGLEIVYLLGSFGASVRGTDVTMTAPPTTLGIGDWVKQGLSFYSGSVSYNRSIRPKLGAGERLFVRVGRYDGAAVRVLVNGRSAGVIAWEPNEVEITDLLGDGPVALAVEVIGHRRNSHGPLHLTDKAPRWTGAGQFVCEEDQWTDGYSLVACGLQEPPRLIVRR